MMAPQEGSSGRTPVANLVIVAGPLHDQVHRPIERPQLCTATSCLGMDRALIVDHMLIARANVVALE